MRIFGQARFVYDSADLVYLTSKNISLPEIRVYLYDVSSPDPPRLPCLNYLSGCSASVYWTIARLQSFGVINPGDPMGAGATQFLVAMETRI